MAATTFTPYLTLHLPRPVRADWGQTLATWRDRPSVASQLAHVGEADAPLHVSVLYGLPLPQATPAVAALQLPNPLQLRLGQSVRYFKARDGLKTAGSHCRSRRTRRAR